jgi:hypothetical protein
MNGHFPLDLMQDVYPDPVSPHPDDVKQEKQQGGVIEQHCAASAADVVHSAAQTAG